MRILIIAVLTACFCFDLGYISGAFADWACERTGLKREECGANESCPNGTKSRARYTCVWSRGDRVHGNRAPRCHGGIPLGGKLVGWRYATTCERVFR
jgi:hypothetical protein